MTPRKNALVWRLVIPVAIAILPPGLTPLAAQSGRTPDGILKVESYQTPPEELPDAVAALEKYVQNPQKPEPKKMTTDQALVVR